MINTSVIMCRVERYVQARLSALHSISEEGRKHAISEMTSLRLALCMTEEQILALRNEWLQTLEQRKHDREQWGINFDAAVSYDVGAL